MSLWALFTTPIITRLDTQRGVLKEQVPYALRCFEPWLNCTSSKLLSETLVCVMNVYMFMVTGKLHNHNVMLHWTHPGHTHLGYYTTFHDFALLCWTQWQVQCVCLCRCVRVSDAAVKWFCSAIHLNTKQNKNKKYTITCQVSQWFIQLYWGKFS